MTSSSPSILISSHWKQPPRRRRATCLLGLLFSVGLLIKADARTFLPFGRLIAGSASISQHGATVDPLEPAKPIDRELKDGQSHSYLITVTPDQFLHVVVEQRGINVVMTLLDPRGTKLTEVDSAKDNQESEPGQLVSGSEYWAEDLKSGDSQCLEKIFVVASAPNRLKLSVFGKDHTSLVPGYSERNSIVQEFDLTQYPGGSVTVPFTLQTRPLREYRSDLQFDVSGRIDISPQ